MNVEIKCQGSQSLPLDLILDFQGNLKSLSNTNFERLKKEIINHGFSEPISVWQNDNKYYCLNGHQRLKVLRKMKENGDSIPPIPVSLIHAKDIKEAKEKVLALASQYGQITDDGLAEFLKASDIKLDFLNDNFSFPEIDMPSFEKEFFKDDAKDAIEDDIPEVKSTDIKLGDLFQLGEHRLMCGDSTKIEDVEKLMGGQKTVLFLTDPPYGVFYSERQKMMNEWGKKTGKRGGNKSITINIENDHGSIEESGQVWFKAYSNAILNSNDDSTFYIFSPQGGDLMMMMMIQKACWTLKHMLVWKKNNHVLGRCDYHYKHEPIFYGWNKKHNFYGNSSCVSVLEFNKPLKNDLHPTMKPIELLEILILNSSQKKEIVLDVFLGSGSTLIACEKTNRKCFGIEIDPHYCQVIIDRWEKYSGKKSQKLT